MRISGETDNESIADMVAEQGESAGLHGSGERRRRPKPGVIPAKAGTQLAVGAGGEVGQLPPGQQR